MTSAADRTRLEAVAAALASAQHAVFLTGAGLSVASGISPYRKAPDALWNRTIMDWATVARFVEDPHAWWSFFWLKSHGTDLNEKTPNAGHDAITAIVRQHPDAVVITQNIDGLHRKSGLPEDRLIEIHGRHDRFICMNTSCVHAREALKHIDLTVLERGDLPRCPACNSPLRPLVLLFDELYDSHPAYQMRKAQRALRSASIVVCVGTSFSVGITDHAVRAARLSKAMLVNINVEEAPEADFVDLRGPAEITLPALAAAVRGIMATHGPADS